jgi:hypothetical protein
MIVQGGSLRLDKDNIEDIKVSCRIYYIIIPASKELNRRDRI